MAARDKLHERFQDILPLFLHDRIPNRQVGSVPPWCALISTTFCAARWKTSQQYAHRTLMRMVEEDLISLLKVGTRGKHGVPSMYGLTESGVPEESLEAYKRYLKEAKPRVEGGSV